jgi:hypothetical protein
VPLPLALLGRTRRTRNAEVQALVPPVTLPGQEVRFVADVDDVRDLGKPAILFVEAGGVRVEGPITVGSYPTLGDGSIAIDPDTGAHYSHAVGMPAAPVRGQSVRAGVILDRPGVADHVIGGTLELYP